jgi:MscS family membrane protein
MIVPALAKRFIADQVFITGRVFAVTEFGLNLLSLGALTVVVLGTANRLATAVGALPWFQPQGVDAQLIRLVVRVSGVAAALVTLLEGGRYLGVPIPTLIAGASVSGVAVALAAQDSLKNLFGSLMILLDKPFQVGDQIRVKAYEGVVEDIGLRSTKLRLANGHMATIANDEIARLDIENISRRPYLRRTETIRLRSDTPPEKVQQAAEIVRRLLENHEGMDPDLPPQVRVGGLDGTVVALTMTYWYHPPRPLDFAAFSERVNLGLLERFQAEGIRFA